MYGTLDTPTAVRVGASGLTLRSMSGKAASASRGYALSLYRQLLSSSKRLPTKQRRDEAVLSVRESFRLNAQVTDPSKASTLRFSLQHWMIIPCGPMVPVRCYGMREYITLHVSKALTLKCKPYDYVYTDLHTADFTYDSYS